MIFFIFGFFLGATAGITLMCLTIVAKENKSEEIDYTTIYLSGFYDGEDKWKDKIKNRLSELMTEEERQPEILAKINIEMIINELIRILEVS